MSSTRTFTSALRPMLASSRAMPARLGSTRSYAQPAEAAAAKGARKIGSGLSGTNMIIAGATLAIGAGFFTLLGKPEKAADNAHMVNATAADTIDKRKQHRGARVPESEGK